MINIKTFGFTTAVLFTTFGGLFIAAPFLNDFKFPIPILLALTALLFFMGSAILLLLVVIINHLQNSHESLTPKQTTDEG